MSFQRPLEAPRESAMQSLYCSHRHVVSREVCHTRLCRLYRPTANNVRSDRSLQEIPAAGD